VQLDRSRRQLSWEGAAPEPAAAAGVAAAAAAGAAAALAAARPASPEVRDALQLLVGQNRELSCEVGALRSQLDAATRGGALSPGRERRAGGGRLAWGGGSGGGRELGGQRKGWSPGGGADSREARPLQYAPKMSCAFGL
jgi:hypothetical protein